MIAARPKKSSQIEGQTIVGKNFKLIFVCLVVLLVIFAFLGFIAELENINADAFWELDTGILGFIGGLLAGKTSA